MYVTRPLSLYKRNPGAVSLPPPEGPNSGYLVLQDEESTPRCCFGLCKYSSIIGDFPFPQNKLLVVTNRSDESTTSNPVYFIPAINHPLSYNTYYAIKPNGRHKGEAYASSGEEEKVGCCFCNCVKDAKPRPLDPTDIYQQFRFSKVENCGNLILSATSVASDGHPPSFIRGKEWSIYSRTPKNFSLCEVAGLDPRLRARLPDFNFPMSYQASKSEVVGKWYCPFMFIKDLITPKQQVKKSMFYEMSLEQQWERIFLYESDYTRSTQGKKTMPLDITVQTESVTVEGIDAEEDRQGNDVNAVVWFKRTDGIKDEHRVGLSSLIIERMMWEEERAGWVRKVEKQEKVSRIEEFGGIGMWTRCGCYMLVERFVLKRMDGSVATDLATTICNCLFRG